MNVVMIRGTIYLIASIEDATLQSYGLMKIKLAFTKTAFSDFLKIRRICRRQLSFRQP